MLAWLDAHGESFALLSPFVASRMIIEAGYSHKSAAGLLACTRWLVPLLRLRWTWHEEPVVVSVTLRDPLDDPEPSARAERTCPPLLPRSQFT